MSLKLVCEDDIPFIQRCKINHFFDVELVVSMSRYFLKMFFSEHILYCIFTTYDCKNSKCCFLLLLKWWLPWFPLKRVDVIPLFYTKCWRQRIEVSWNKNNESNYHQTEMIQFYIFNYCYIQQVYIFLISAFDYYSILYLT